MQKKVHNSKVKYACARIREERKRCQNNFFVDYLLDKRTHLSEH